MADRVVKVTLSAVVKDYARGMQEAAEATRNVGTQAEKLAQTKESLNTLGRAGMVAGGLLAAGVGVAIAKFADFQEAMSYVQAATHESAENMGLLRDAALEAGSSTVFSATESANAIEELAKAGVSTADILNGGLKGALDLAAAGGLGVAEAAGIAATTLQQFRLRGEDASHVADLLAAGAGKAMGDVSDMSQALNQSGLVASQFGISVEETTGTLAAFAQAGLLGSDAGTSFRTMLLRLANPTGESAELMKELGIQAYNSQGQFIGLAGLAGVLQKSLSGMTDQQKQATLAQIFGQDAIRASTILLKEGESGIRDWTAAVDDQGYAAETAAIRLDNLKGDWEAFTGALDTAFIQMGAGADGPLRALIQGLTSLVEGFTDLPEWVQQSTVVLGGVLAVIGLVGGAALVAIPKIWEMRVAMQNLGITTAGAKASLSNAATFLGGPWGIAITAAVAAVTVWLATQQRMAAAASEFRETLDETTGAVTDYTRELIAKKLQEAGAFDAVKDAGVSQKELTDAIFEGGDAYDELYKKLKSAHDASGGFNAVLGNGINAVREMHSQLEDAQTGFENIEAATESSASATDTATAATEDLAQAAQDAETDLSDMKQALKDVGDTAIGMGESSDRAQSALNKLAEAAKAEGAAIDGTNDASISLRDNMRDVEESHRNAAAAILENGGSMEDATAKYNQGRDAIIELLKSKGLDEAAARQWADTNYGSADSVVQALGNVSRAVSQVPDRKVIQLIADTAPAYAAVERFVFDNNGRRINLYVDGYIGRQVNGENVVARATGGPVIGPGTSTSDSIPAMLSNNEHVWTAAEVAAAGGHAAVSKLRAAVLTGKQIETPQRYASSAPSVGVVQAGPVYVQNPFTGEYLLARTVEVADASAVSATAGFASTFRGGRR